MNRFTPKRLKEFSLVASQWFKDRPMVQEHYEFFQKFFQPENLKSLDWEKISAMKGYIHSFKQNALAGKRAFGNPNHEISYYIKSFTDLAHGPGSVANRIDRFTDIDGNKIKGLNNSSWSEIIGNLYAEDYPFANSRTEWALRYLMVKPDYLYRGQLSERLERLGEIIEPLKKRYLEIVGRKTELPLNLEIDQFFSWINETFKKTEKERFWIIGAGNGAIWFDKWLDQNVISLGWNHTGDLRGLDTKGEISDLLREGQDTNPRNDTRACWDFANEMNIGDTVFVKKGISQIVGMGTITGDYEFDRRVPGLPDMHLRSVEWKHKGEWQVPEHASLLPKTLTEITSSPTAIDALMSLFDGKERVAAKDYWWINVNTKIWDPSSKAVGETQHYTTHNEEGNKRRVYSHFESVKPGDLAIGYLTSPHQMVTCVFEITKGIFERENQEIIEFKKLFDLEVPVSAEDLKKDSRLSECEPVRSNQGSLFKLTPEEFKVMEEKWSTAEVKTKLTEDAEPYNFSDLSKDSFAPDDVLKEMIEAIERKKNIILQGPPGTGKSFLGERLAYALMGQKDKSRVTVVQFHQSYSYEDFIQGLRPDTSGNWILKSGVFLRFCREAQKDTNRKHFFIIDEINRGNTSKIFGELLMLMEHDKRGPKFSIPLTYSNDSTVDTFFIPENVYIIGTMNTADRSLSVVDYALRRRFSFFDLRPEFGKKFHDHLTAKGVKKDLIKDIEKKLTDLNNEISADTKYLGPGFTIGHSFFCDPTNDHNKWYGQVIKTEIAALLKEYWHDKEAKVNERLSKLA